MKRVIKLLTIADDRTVATAYVADGVDSKVLPTPCQCEAAIYASRSDAREAAGWARVARRTDGNRTDKVVVVRLKPTTGPAMVDLRRDVLALIRKEIHADRLRVAREIDAAVARLADPTDVWTAMSRLSSSLRTTGHVRTRLL